MFEADEKKSDFIEKSDFFDCKNRLGSVLPQANCCFLVELFDFRAMSNRHVQFHFFSHFV